MGKPESRRFTRAAAPEPPQGEIRPLRPGEIPAPPPSGKTTRKIPRTTRRAASAGEEGGGAVVAQASTEAKSQNQMLLIGGVGGSILLLLIVIAVAASSGSSGRGAPEAAQRSKRPVVDTAPPPPREPPRQYNYVRNTGSIVFVCGGTDKHPDREIVLSACLKCKTKNEFAWEEGAGYRCSSCKTVYEKAAIKCDKCDREARVTHLKKVASYLQQ